MRAFRLCQNRITHPPSGLCSSRVPRLTCIRSLGCTRLCKASSTATYTAGTRYGWSNCNTPGGSFSPLVRLHDHPFASVPSVC